MKRITIEIFCHENGQNLVDSLKDIPFDSEYELDITEEVSKASEGCHIIHNFPFPPNLIRFRYSLPYENNDNNFEKFQELETFVDSYTQHIAQKVNNPEKYAKKDNKMIEKLFTAGHEFHDDARKRLHNCYKM